MAFPSAALFLLLYSSGRLTQAVGQGQGSDQRFHGGFGRLLLKYWCISHAFAPTVHPFYYFLSTQVIILDLPLFVPNSHWESLIVSIMTTFAGFFFVVVSSLFDVPTHFLRWSIAHILGYLLSQFKTHTHPRDCWAFVFPKDTSVSVHFYTS